MGSKIKHPRRNKREPETVDYASIKLDPNKPMEQYDTYERRAFILKMIEESGSPYTVNVALLAEKFRVHHSIVYVDIKILGAYYRERLSDTVEFDTDAFYAKAVKELRAKGNFKLAAQIIKDRNEWLFMRGVLRKEPEKVVNLTISPESLWADFQARLQREGLYSALDYMADRYMGRISDVEVRDAESSETPPVPPVRQ